MKELYKKSIGLLLLISLLAGLSGCSSDPLTDTTKFFSVISRIERQTPGGMNFSEEQAQQLLDIISPVVSGIPYTEDLAKKILNDTEKLLSKEQRALIDENMDATGTPGQGTGVPGSGGDPNMAGSGGGNPGGGTTGSSSGINLFLRLDEIITENYLSN